MIVSLWRWRTSEKHVESALPIVIVQGGGLIVSRDRKLDVIGGSNYACNGGKSSCFYVCQNKEKK